MVAVVKAVSAPIAPREVRAVVAAAVEVPEVAARLPQDAEVAVRITGDRELRRLNRDFLGEDTPTDVLAFPSGEQSGHVGDIAVSWPAVIRQAAEHGHPAGAELALLVVHGLLHLLGWNHADEGQREEMTRLTRAALDRARVEIAAGRI